MCIRDRLGVTAGSATAITADEIIDLVYSLKAPYRKNAVFLMNDATVKAIRKLKDGQGQYPVSYTHLDVYKRQPWKRNWRMVVIRCFDG